MVRAWSWFQFGVESVIAKTRRIGFTRACELPFLFLCDSHGAVDTGAGVAFKHAAVSGEVLWVHVAGGVGIHRTAGGIWAGGIVCGGDAVAAEVAAVLCFLWAAGVGESGSLGGADDGVSEVW
jgi:hypothetical protein